MPCAIITTPIGGLSIESSGDELVRIQWVPDTATSDSRASGSLLKEAARQLQAYFERRLTEFDLPLAPAATLRGNVLRQAIAAIPYGETASYGQVARTADTMPRALGQACARNPFPIVIPCHRVLAAGGALGHYSGGRGVETKLALLRLEAPDFEPNG